MKRCPQCANCSCVTEKSRRARERATKRKTISVKRETRDLLQREAKLRGTTAYALVEAALTGVLP